MGDDPEPDEPREEALRTAVQPPGVGRGFSPTG